MVLQLFPSENNFLHIVMELCVGGDLDGVVKRQKDVHFPQETVSLSKSLHVLIF